MFSSLIELPCLPKSCSLSLDCAFHCLLLFTVFLKTASRTSAILHIFIHTIGAYILQTVYNPSCMKHVDHLSDRVKLLDLVYIDFHLFFSRQVWIFGMTTLLLIHTPPPHHHLVHMPRPLHIDLGNSPATSVPKHSTIVPTGGAMNSCIAETPSTSALCVVRNVKRGITSLDISTPTRELNLSSVRRVFNASPGRAVCHYTRRNVPEAFCSRQNSASYSGFIFESL